MDAMQAMSQMGMWGGLGMQQAMAMAMNPMAMMGAWNPAMGSMNAIGQAVQASVPLTFAATPAAPGGLPPGTEGARSKASAPPPLVPPAHAQPVAAPEAKAPPKTTGVTVIMAMTAQNDQGYVVEKDEEVINELLDADWTWFVQLVGLDPNAVVGRGTSLGVAIGIQEVADRINEVQAFFVVPEVGRSGEELAINAAMSGGRSYIMSPFHELYQDVSKWRCAAILKSAKPLIPEPRRKKRKDDGNVKVAPSKSKARQAEEADHRAKDLRQLPKDIIYLGSTEGLEDTQAIPELAKKLANRYLYTLGNDVVFKTFADAFRKLEGRVAYRKSLVYVAHEIFAKRKKEITLEDQKQCIEKFLLPIGPEIRAMKAREREVYCELVVFWAKYKVMSQKDLKRLKDAWDVDEEGDFDDLDDV